MSNKPQHPSGRPIKQNIQKRSGYFRAPLDGYLTPRLRPSGNISAIGFTADVGGAENQRETSSRSHSPNVKNTTA